MLDRMHERLAAARSAAGYPTRTAFARACGVKPPSYRLHEKGEREFKRMAARYAEMLRDKLPDITAEWLLYGEGEPPVGVLGPQMGPPRATTAIGEPAALSSGPAPDPWLFQSVSLGLSEVVAAEGLFVDRQRFDAVALALHDVLLPDLGPGRHAITPQTLRHLLPLIRVALTS